jgi:hypothetical protein
VCFYRPWEPSESFNFALIDMNRSYVGAVENGGAFYRDSGGPMKDRLWQAVYNGLRPLLNDTDVVTAPRGRARARKGSPAGLLR